MNDKPRVRVAPQGPPSSPSTGAERLPSSTTGRPFVYAAPGEIQFGWGTAEALPEQAARFGRRPLLVTGSALRRTGRLEPLIERLRAAGLGPVLHESVPVEPALAEL